MYTLKTQRHDGVVFYTYLGSAFEIIGRVKASDRFLEYWNMQMGDAAVADPLFGIIKAKNERGEDVLHWLSDLGVEHSILNPDGSTLFEIEPQYEAPASFDPPLGEELESEHISEVEPIEVIDDVYTEEN